MDTNKAYERDRVDARSPGDPAVAPGEADVYRERVGPDDRTAEARDRSITSLLKELRDETTTLFRQEIALAKTEMSEKASKAGKQAASIGAGAAVLMAGALVLLLGVAALLYWALVAMGVSHYVSGWLAPVIVGGVTALIGYGMVQKGVSTLKHMSVVPEKTVDSIKKDKQWLQNQTK
jgi:hypothetical protein